MIALSELTLDQQNDIAEFVYSLKADILIKSDAINVVKVLHAHNLIENYDLLIANIENNIGSPVSDIMEILNKNISDEDKSVIMGTYFQGS